RIRSSRSMLHLLQPLPISVTEPETMHLCDGSRGLLQFRVARIVASKQGSATVCHDRLLAVQSQQVGDDRVGVSSQQPGVEDWKVANTLEACVHPTALCEVWQPVCQKHGQATAHRVAIVIASEQGCEHTSDHRRC